MFGWHRSVSACCLHTWRYLQEICTHIKIASTWLCFQVDSSSDERCMQIFWITLLSSALKPPFQTSVGSTCSVVVFSVGFSFNRCANCQQVRLSWCCLTEVAKKTNAQFVFFHANQNRKKRVHYFEKSQRSLKLKPPAAKRNSKPSRKAAYLQLRFRDFPAFVHIQSCEGMPNGL